LFQWLLEYYAASLSEVVAEQLSVLIKAQIHVNAAMSPWTRERAATAYNSTEYLQGIHPIPVVIICYHCQQSGEKYLKGYLVLKDVEPPKTHDLRVLVLTRNHDQPHIIPRKGMDWQLHPVSSRFTHEATGTKSRI